MSMQSTWTVLSQHAVDWVQHTKSSDGLNVVAGFSERRCCGGILLWNNATTDIEGRLLLTGIPFPLVDITEWRLDEEHPVPVHHPY